MRCAAADRRMAPLFRPGAGSKSSFGRRILRREWSETGWGWVLVTASYPRPHLPHTPAPTSVIPAPPFPSYPRLSRVSRRQRTKRHEPPSALPAPHPRHSRHPFLHHSRHPRFPSFPPPLSSSFPPPSGNLPRAASDARPHPQRPPQGSVAPDLIEPAPGLNRGPKPNPTRRRGSGIGCCSQRDTHGKRGYDGGGSVWWSAKDAGLSAKDAGEQGALGWRVACARFAVNGRATNHADSTHSVPAAIIASPFG